MEQCLHKEFYVSAMVYRLFEGEDDGTMPIGYSMDVTVKCTACNVDFKFNGLNAGININGPTTNIDGTELRIPISVADGEQALYPSNYKPKYEA